MKRQLKFIIFAGISIVVLGVFLLGCDDQSENIPTSWEGIDALMAQGWAAYAADDFDLAREYFLEANQRNAFYLPAYNGLGWCAVRMNDFATARIQFSFITTLADPVAQADLLADAYAGLCLSATIERSVLEISGEGSPEQFEDLAWESINMADSVFALLGEDYDPADHDPGFGSRSLHLMNAQNYFYLQEFGNLEAELSVADTTNFLDSLLTVYGTGDTDTVGLTMEVVEADTLWYLELENPGIHDYTIISVPDELTGFDLEYVLNYSENYIQVIAPEGTPLEEDLEFIVSYTFIEDYAVYLSALVDRIQELIKEL